MRRMWLWLGAVIALVVGTACAKKPMESYADEAAYYEAERGAYEADDGAAAGMSVGSSGSAPRRAKRAPAPAPSTSGRMPPAPEPEPDAQVAPEEPASKRMIAYEGSTTLRVARIRPAVDAITATVEELGGFVERVDGARLVVRVPVARFQEGLEAVQAHGDVIDERIMASDVTEAFQDVKLRLDTAIATRERLVELLAKAEDEQTKLMLIREIQRLTDQIDQMSAQASTLQRMADLSRISIRLVEREALAHQGAADAQAFRWIRQLSPFGGDVVRAGNFVNLDVPEGMVGLKLWREYVAEAPDGSRIWSGRLHTSVQADGDFWIEAIEDRLAQDFASASVSTLGDYTVLTLTSRDEDPYTWVIAVHPHGRKLDVVEAYLSSPQAAERFLPAVQDVIAGRGGES